MRAVLLALLLAPVPAHAGMPSITLSELAKARVDALSFFLVALLVLALGVRALWNALARDFAGLPRLDYKRALAFTALWGLAFHLVLTMISGARELMTPGAWVRDGATHRLATKDEQLLHARKERLIALRDALWRHAEANGGSLPLHARGSEIPAALWQSAHPSGARYVFRGGGSLHDGSLVAWEPEVYGRDRLVLDADGGVKLQRVDDGVPR